LTSIRSCWYSSFGHAGPLEIKGVKEIKGVRKLKGSDPFISPGEIRGRTMLTIGKDNIDKIDCLMDQVHDRYFDFDDIAFDESSGEWKLSLGEKRKYLLGGVVVTKVLRITGVRHCSCNDLAKIGQNSINEIHVDLHEGTIDIECNAPAEIKLSVTRDFEISVERKS
jgi:hypothetical protein